MHEEEKEQAEGDVIFSRELSFVPARRTKLQDHDPQTVALIRRHAELERLPHGAAVRALLDKWQWVDRMSDPAEKQRMLEPHIAAVQRDPEANEDRLIFLMVVFEPLRRSVSKAFVRARSGLERPVRDVSWSNRSEARMLHEVARQELFDVTREAALEAVFRYPSPPPPKFFPWLRETIAHRALDRLAGELPQVETSSHTAAEADALQAALAGFELAEGPTMSERSGWRPWRERVQLRSVFEVVEEFFDHDAVREVCRAAVGRLSPGQKEIIGGYFFEELDVKQLADRRRISESTVYNHKAQAQKRLHDDDLFFAALADLGRVRDRARAESIAERHPGRRLPDGRRIVSIDEAA